MVTLNVNLWLYFFVVIVVVLLKMEIGCRIVTELHKYWQQRDKSKIDPISQLGSEYIAIGWIFDRRHNGRTYKCTKGNSCRR